MTLRCLAGAQNGDLLETERRWTADESEKYEVIVMLREAGLHYSRAILLLWDRTWKANSERGIARITWMDAKRSFHNMSTCNDPTVCRDCDSCTYDLAVCWAPDLDGEVPEVLSTDLLSGAGYVRFS